MRHTRARLRLTAVVSATAAGLLLAGCTSPDAPITATIETLATPASMSPTVPHVTLASLLPATDDLPFVAAATVSEPGGPSVGTVYTSTDGTAWKESAVTAELEGSFSGGLAGDETLTVYAGTLWTAGIQSSVLFTSTDRTAWNQVALPEELAARYRITDLAVRGSVVFAIGTDSAGASTGVRIDGTEVVEFALPSVGEGELLSAATLVAGESLVLIARPGDEGENNPIVSFVSDDAGASWSDSSPLAGVDSFVVGAVAVDGGYLATGSTPLSSEPGAPTAPAAWFSPDGASWSAETVPGVAQGVFFFDGRSSVGLGAPTANGDAVAAVAWNDNSAYSGIYRRTSGGVWSFVSESSVNAGNGLGGLAVAVDEVSTVSLLGGSGFARLAIIQPENGWIDTEVLSEREDISYVDAIYPAPLEESSEGDDVAVGRTVMTLGTSSFTVNPDGGWRNQTSFALAEVTDKAVEIVPWEPERASRLSGVQLASNPEGAEVMVGANFPEGSNAILAEGWFRASPDDEWTPIAGFEGSGATHFVGAAYIGDRWLAWGDVRDTSALSAPSHALMWSSTDGQKWMRDIGDFGGGALETQLSDVCALPNGDAIGIGWIEEAGGEFRTAVWKYDDGQWTRADIGDLGSSYGYGSSCATGDDGVVLNAYSGGRSTLQLSSDGSEWTEVFRAERGIDFGEPVAVDGGYAASGQLVDGNLMTPVVWLSADGRDWKPVTIPSTKAGATTSVAPYGAHLIVTMSGRIGDPAVVVRDIATLIGG